MMRRKDGVSLVELLITMAILGVILSVLVAVLSSTARAYQANERVAERQQALEGAKQLLTYEIALAGYKGTDDGESDRSFSGDKNTLVVTKGDGAPDTLAVRYFEDRFTTTDAERHVVFGVDSANKLLTRTENGGTTETVIDDLSDFKVVQYITRSGDKIAADAGVAVPDNVAALNLELTFADGRVWRFPVGLTNAQQSAVN